MYKDFQPPKIHLEVEKVIHTIKLFFPIEYYEVMDLQKRFNIYYRHLNDYFADHYGGRFKGVTIHISNKGNGQWKLYMFIDAILLLGKSDLTEDDYPLIEQEIKNILWILFRHFSHFKHHILQRIDYRYDVIVKEKHHRELLLHLYQKLTKSHRYQKKYIGKLDAEGVFQKYETTVYHSSKSVQAVVYSKEEERMFKKEEIQVYEKNVLRFEVRILQDHINYMARKDKGNSRPKKLKEYMKEEIYRDYFRKYMSPIYHAGDFYKLEEARKRIRKSPLTDSNKNKLIGFLKQVSSHSIDTPLKSMTDSTFRNRLKKLSQLGINPIPIPKNYPKAPTTLSNPFDKFLW